MLEMQLSRIVIRETSDQQCIYLKEKGGERQFPIVIGIFEAWAIDRKVRDRSTQRPMTHDLVHSVFLGFDLTIKQIVISEIVDNAFCATLVLEQKVTEKNGEWVGRRNEVRIDARPSDCLVLALKNRADIFVTDEVFEQVQDFSEVDFPDAPWNTADSDLEIDILRPRHGEFPNPTDPEGEEHEEEDDE